MKFVSSLTAADRAALEQLNHDGVTSRQRQRAHAVLLSANGYSLDQLADILRSDRDTVSSWLDGWQERGLEALSDAPKPGRRRKIDAALEQDLLDILAHPTPNLKAALQADLKKKVGKSPGTP